MSDLSTARSRITAEAAREYRLTLVEHYNHSRQDSPQVTRAAPERPTEAQLPASLREVIQRLRDQQSQRRFEVLKYRHTLNDNVVTELDDGAPLPPPDQIMVASVTNSVVLGDQITVEVHMVIGSWQSAGR